MVFQPSPVIPSSKVGRPVRIESLVLPGTRLEPRADAERTAPVSVRCVDVAPHGTLLRYTFEVTGWEPGDHDLRAYLVRADGSTTADLPPIPVSIQSVLGAGMPRVEAPPPEPPHHLGGYGQTLLIASIAWLVGLGLLLRVLRRGPVSSGPAVARASAQDQLARLLAKSQDGRLDAADAAAIERLVYDAWRRALHLEAAEPRALVAALRCDRRADAALDRLEAWLHAPGGLDMPAETATFVGTLLPPRSMETVP